MKQDMVKQGSLWVSVVSPISQITRRHTQHAVCLESLNYTNPYFTRQKAFTFKKHQNKKSQGKTGHLIPMLETIES